MLYIFILHASYSPGRINKKDASISDSATVKTRKRSFIVFQQSFFVRARRSTEADVVPF